MTNTQPVPRSYYVAPDVLAALEAIRAAYIACDAADGPQLPWQTGSSEEYPMCHLGRAAQAALARVLAYGYGTGPATTIATRGLAMLVWQTVLDTGESVEHGLGMLARGELD